MQVTSFGVLLSGKKIVLLVDRLAKGGCTHKFTKLTHHLLLKINAYYACPPHFCTHREADSF